MIVQVPFSPCTQRSQRKRTTRRPNAGKQMPRGSLSSCVSLIVSIPPHSAQILQTGLFSTAITSLIAVSLPDLKPNPQDISTFHLEKIHQLLANRYTPPASTLPTLAR